MEEPERPGPTPTRQRFRSGWTNTSRGPWRRVSQAGDDEDEEDEEPLAAWEALLLPNLRWEAFEKEDNGLYYSRVKGRD